MYYYKIMLNNIKNIVNQNNERINWDEYFMSIALLASCRSPCCRLHVGSVIIALKGRLSGTHRRCYK